MNLIKYAINKPISVAVGVILVVMFGLIGVIKLPVQLTPDVELPEVTVATVWPGASPYEVEQEVIEDQEDKLKGLKNLIKMESSSYNNYGEISLTFEVGTDLESALLRVSNKINEVSSYPENVQNPSIEASGAQSSPVIWIMFKMKDGDDNEVDKFRTFFEDEVRQNLERVEGVGSLFVGGGTEKELHLEIDVDKTARHNIAIDQITGRVSGANRNVAAGVKGIGKKDYRIRTVSQFQKPGDLNDVVIFDDGIKRIFLNDIATPKFGYADKDAMIMQNGDNVVVVGVRKEQGANVIELVERMRKEVDRLNSGILAEKNLYLDWVYDEAPYILRAMSLVKKNVIVGGLLAVTVLILFLRSLSATFTTAIAIPVSAIGTFIFLWGFGRNLNVVSLAGISFAVGMLVDNAIVVLENIERHRSLGKKAFDACYEGAREVFGAVFASTVTTVAVFIPIIFIQEEAGQLFRDIAIAITFSIIISLIASIGVIPSILNQFYKRRPYREKKSSVVSNLGETLAGVIMGISQFCLKNKITRIASVAFFTLFSLAIVVILMPKAEYLPQGNRNLVLGILIPPPGNSVQKRQEIGDYISAQLKPHVDEDGVDGFPQIKNFFYVAVPRFNLVGTISHHETRAKEMLPLLNRVINSIPDMFGVGIQAGIFQSDIGAGRNIDVNISGEQIGDITDIAKKLFFGGIAAKIPGVQVRPIPGVEIAYPEVSLVPDKRKLAANGLTESELGVYVDILMGGRKIDEYRPEGKRQLDLVMKSAGEVVKTPEDLLNIPIINRFGNSVTIGDVAGLKYSKGMTQVNHLERKRTIKLQVTPPADVPLQEAMEIIENDILKGMAEKGELDKVSITIGGNADKLLEMMNALKWNFLLAVLITYLLMAALFENFFYPLIIMFTVPLAAAGGFIGYRLVDTLIAPQGFDILTMLGFIILVGTVVNNAILIVHQSLNNVRYNGMEGLTAISDSVRTRIRPIFMSACTSLFGMLPLVLSTGSGSELYRGLGSVLLGGLALSTLLTLFVIPSLLSFAIGMEGKTNEIQY